MTRLSIGETSNLIKGVFSGTCIRHSVNGGAIEKGTLNENNYLKY